jgi:type II secretory pathway pseudopilin PulG
MTRSLSRRPGFGLLEALVLLMVLAIMATVLATNGVAVASVQRLERAERDLQRLRDALDAFEQDIHHCPEFLTQLYTPLQGPPNGDRDLLEEPYKQGETQRWKGPYYNLLISSTGPQVGIGTVVGLRPILLDPIVPALLIDADILDAVALDVAIDGGDGAAAGGIWWYPSPRDPDLVEIEYRLLDIACAPGASA